ncbi:hypothetical protein L596_012501 [Steinernema carpocapsae]|uniref:G-protein coupled receptors family 1 profile domain-containing protein n=1 Tax=Steinernema carpocapsae TaxID=34508 RepID=A0A4U5NY23_STECR|nr:hypothetical protein L596_012501 [Steinernema carpocapsae]
MVFWNASQFSQLVIAINRFVNLYFPFRYEAIFNKNVTSASIYSVWIFALAQGMPYFWADCTLLFDFKSFTFGFIDTRCSVFIGYYLDFDLSIAVVSTIAFIDFTSFLKIHHLQKKGSLHLMRKDVKFFLQTWVQAMASIAELVVYFWVAPLAMDNKWFHFCLTTLSWMLVELVDGCVF